MTAGDREAAIPDLGAEGPPFEEPWQGEAFALVVSLRRAGHIGVLEWTEALAREVAADRESGAARSYHRQWLAALEALLAGKGLVGEAEREARAEAWREAYRATPHGRAVELEGGRAPAAPPSPGRAGAAD